MRSITQTLRRLYYGAKSFIRPSAIVDHIEKFLTDSPPEVLTEYKYRPTKFVSLRDNLVLVVDLWGRNMIVDYKDKKLMPVDPEFASAILEMDIDTIPDDYQDLVSMSNEPTINYVLRENIQVLDEGLVDRIFRKTEISAIRDILETAREVFSHRYVFSNIYGQAPIAPASNVIRAMLVSKYLDRGSSILLIGDNDALSIILASLGYDVCVLDIDQYVCMHLKGLAEKYGVDVRVFNIDVRRPFTIDQEFDAFVTDPEHTPACLYVFVLRGIQNTKPNGLGIVSWEAGFRQRRIMKAIIRRFHLDVLELRKDVIYYISPLSNFYEHITRLSKRDIEISIPKWHGDVWVLRKKKQIEKRDVEFTISLY